MVAPLERVKILFQVCILQLRDPAIQIRFLAWNNQIQSTHPYSDRNFIHAISVWSQHPNAPNLLADFFNARPAVRFRACCSRKIQRKRARECRMQCFFPFKMGFFLQKFPFWDFFKSALQNISTFWGEIFRKSSKKWTNFHVLDVKTGKFAPAAGWKQRFHRIFVSEVKTSGSWMSERESESSLSDSSSSSSSSISSGKFKIATSKIITKNQNI